MADSINPNGANPKSSDFLPRIYRSDANKKFLQATVDQLVQPGVVKKVDGYIGRQNAKASTGNDIFLKAASTARQNYQLEPGLLVNDDLGNTTFFKDYQDYINQIRVFGGNVSNHARLNEQEFYSWDPHIDWDMFVNFQNYYWLPYGPDVIKIAGQAEKIESTFDVVIESQLDSNAYVFSPDGSLGLVRNPTIKLYRGQTYTFKITSSGNPFSIKRLRTPGSLDRYQDVGLSGNAVENGTLTFTVPHSAPDILYYVSEFDVDLGGVFQILSIEENTKIDVSSEILGKKTYTLTDGTTLSNGMKVTFIGNVTPAEYSSGYFYVEGVGSSITLINEHDLTLASSYTQTNQVLFDTTPFDSMPFSDATAYAGQRDYIVIDRASKDRNPWSRSNRWFHKDVIETSARVNGKIPELDQTYRAVRPIIEFESNLKLFNFGTQAITDVDLVDTYTPDVFSMIEGQLGYNIDGVNLVNGHKILFTADTDSLVVNNIYKVEFLTLNGVRQIHLVQEETPTINDVVLVKQGTAHGQMYWYNGTTWNVAQQKDKLNQAPLFDVVDSDKNSYGDKTVYDGSTFVGTPLFSYKIGTGTTDANLGFPLAYKNINNTGDIVFNFNLLSDVFLYKNVNNVITKEINTGFLVKTNESTTYVNGWQKSLANNNQAAIRIYKNSGKVNNFDVDVYDNIQQLDDIVVRIYVNGIRLESDKWSLLGATELGASASYMQVVLNTDISEADVLTIKTFANQPINSNGFYEIPINLQNNPLNEQIVEFTLGEVIDHVSSIVDNTPEFVGSFPGSNNIRDLGNVTPYGTKFVQHSGPMGLALYHITSDDNNVIRAIEHASNEYNRFKRNFITTANTIGIDADTVELVDLILEKINKDKPRNHPYYFSDMVPFGAKLKTSITVVDPRIKYYPLTEIFNLTTLSTKAVGVYLNGIQLLHEHQYMFDNQGFVVISDSVDLNEDDTIVIYEYENTNGSFVPPTPTKLGMWPSYDPKIYVDNTYLTPRTMIQGHDGSIILAYGDFRDDLILELEKRIYNNIKVTYDINVFDINDVVPGYTRTTPYSLTEFNEVLAPNFYKWTSLIDRDFSKPLSYDRTNSLTFNYQMHTAPDGQAVPGYWRGIYRWMFDTDRPNLCPWEMLGFYDEPSWWQEVYGPAPYTSDNLPLWQDLSNGVVRAPGAAPLVLEKYKRPFLIDHIPVDSQGNVKSPYLSDLAQGVITAATAGDFVFGDCSPIETAWRRSSFYPFSVLTTIMTLQPAKAFSVLLDRSRIVKNIAGQLVYKDTGLRISPSSIKLPSIYSSEYNVQTAGIVNYIVDYILSDNLKSYDTYVSDLANITAKISYRIGGFTSKEKLNLILDSKTPMSQGNVFVPKEDYTLILNSSSPVKKITYSGVIITKLSDGFEVKGYSKTQPYFKCYSWFDSGVSINIGGISEGYSVWTPYVQYTAGKIVQYNNKYYRVKLAHTTTESFDSAYYQGLASLPIIGGRDATLRTKWDRTSEIVVPYSTKFTSIQEVVDFILGYGEWLKDQGFIFDEFNNSLNTVTNWETSVKEFLFWTTQNWSTGEDKWDEWLPNTLTEFGSIVRYNGDYYRTIRNSLPSDIFNEEDFVKLDGLSTVGSSVISLSPAAAKLTFKAPLAVVDDIRNQFNTYEIFKVDGTPIAPNFLNSYRDDNSVSYIPQGDDGIYGATFYLVQKEQVVILNNSTIFNDTIYNPPSGYRQERIRVSGYVNNEWNGSFNIPGFIFDQAMIQNWESWKDYSLGDIVKHKEFYYSASAFLAGTDKFNATDWIKLDKKPTAQMIPNWSYKASQFTDFYSLDSDNFDIDQQTVAQHLVGYQRRQYLSNIIKDNVSEFKFYQGMIVEKGTHNVLNKLFDVLSADNKESLTFHEEWAIRVGQYGACRAFDTIEFVLDETQFKNNPQGIELVNSIPQDVTDFIYRQTPNDVYLKPLGYNNNPWPTTTTARYLRTPGYVRANEVKVSLRSIEDIVDVDITNFVNGDYIWTSFEKDSWNVYRYTDANLKVVDVQYESDLILVCDSNVNLEAGDYIGISQATGISGFYKIDSVVLNKIIIKASNLTVPAPFVEQDRILVFVLRTQRSKNVNNLLGIDRFDQVLPEQINDSEIVWIDDDGFGKWVTMQYTPVFKASEIVNPFPASNLQNGRAVLVNSSGNIALVSNAYGQVNVYHRSNYNLDWFQIQIIDPPDGLNDELAEYTGDVLALSSDSRWLVTGTPFVSTISLYEKDSNNIFTLVETIQSPVPQANDQFGATVVFANNTMLVAAPGYNNNTGVVYQYTFNDATQTWSYDSTLSNTETSDNSYFGKVMLISNNMSTLAITATIGTDNKIFVYNTGDFSLTSSPITPPLGLNDDDRLVFGKTIAVSNTGEYIATSVVLYDNTRVDQGKVFVYKKEGLNYSVYQEITSRIAENSQKFGTKLFFTGTTDSLVVYSLSADNINLMSFDAFVENYDSYEFINDAGVPSTSGYVNDPTSASTLNQTTFDDNSSQFVTRYIDSGRIDVYDKYYTKWIFSESLTHPISDLVNAHIGSNIAVGNDQIIMSLPSAVDGDVISGKVYEYKKPFGKFSWSPIHHESNKPDISKIKKAFLYNKATNKLISYIDVIDPNIGKIPGIADQEIKYKTFYDPATYSIGTSLVNVDDGMAWASNQVGTLWWDLRTAKFLDSYDNDVVYRNSTWNTLATGASIDVYEWVESIYLPSDWNAIADTEEGLANNISGVTLYDDNTYSIIRKYDTISKTFKNTYFYWVKNKKTIPEVANRYMSANDVADLISNPRGNGYKYLAITSANSFSLVNVQPVLEDTNVVLSVEYWLSSNVSQNIHSQWKLISNNEISEIPQEIESKWFDSLCGKDIADRVVPDMTLPIKLRYGIENRPRQSMFINRFEALKQFIEHTNRVLVQNLIVDQRAISSLNMYDAQPSLISGKYDTVIDTDAELRFVTPTPFVRAILSPVIENGRITGAIIDEAGLGYLQPSYLSITGTGTNAVIKTVIDSKGRVIGVDVINTGVGYADSTTVLTVRSYCVLVRSDAAASNKWSIYSYDKPSRTWSRIESQSFDVREYWNYADWYATGYNQFISVDYAVDTFADLTTIETEIGQIVKIRTTQSGTWLLLEKYSDIVSIDWTQTYKIVAAQNGTIQFSSSLYKFEDTVYGYDGALYDGSIFDNSASTELRIILNCIKDNLLVDDLKQSYLDLFFSNVRYALSEQNYLDWIFKTSFVKAQHNVGNLKQKITYNNDNLENFEDYVNEVKPYRTKIREYVSSYNSIDNSETSVTDFDIPSAYDNGILSPVAVRIENGTPTSDNAQILSYPWKHWLDAVGFSVTELRIYDGGSGYISEPVVRFVGTSGTGATARAFIANGKVNRIVLLTPGSGYFTAPTVIVDGGLSESGSAARVIAIIGNSVIRSNMIKMKYDRVSKSYSVAQLQVTETFTGSGSRLQWPLTWAPDIRIGTSSVVINGVDALRDNYKLTTVKSTAKGYTSYSGSITFNTAPEKGATIVVTYLKNWDLLTATDRIQYYYNPTVGNPGKDLAQLMSGIDYGGVIINGMGFETGYGWDSDLYYSDKWDSVDATFDDYIVTVAAGTQSFVLPYTPEAGTEINVYHTKFNVESYESDGIETSYLYNLNDIDPKAYAEILTTAPTSNVNVAGSNTLRVNSTVGIKVGDVVTTYYAIGKVVATSSSDNSITVSSVNGLNINEKIIFKGAAIGNLVAGEYYVKAIFENAITVSLIPDGTTFVQTDSIGSMSFSAHNVFAFNTTVVEVISNTDVKLDQILYDDIGNDASVTFTRELITPTDCVIYTNGVVKLTEPLEIGTTLKISSFLKSIRIDDGSIIMDGTSNVVDIIDFDITVNSGDQFTLRRSTSDGSIVPQDTDYDTSLSGGKDLDGFLGYQTATGLAADDIIVDGDGFVTPTSSSAPEEVVPGQVIDSVSIKVFDRPYSAAANIKVDSYIADGIEREFSISQQPNSPYAVIVKFTTINNGSNISEIKNINDDYTVDYRNRKVVFADVPATNVLVSVFSIGFNGENVLDIDYFVADGVVTEFITKAPWVDNMSFLVYVDGEVLNTSELFKTDNSYETENRVGIRFMTPPDVNQLVSYVIVSGTEQTFALTKTESFAATGASIYDLSYQVGNSAPIESSMIVRVGQTVLKAPNNSYYTIKGNTATYFIDQTKILPYSVTVEDIVVIADGTRLVSGVDYTVTLSDISIKLTQLIRRQYAGKTLIISVVTNQGYVYIPANLTHGPQLQLMQSYTAPDVIEVISSYNHNVLDIQRSTISISSSATLIPNTVEYYNYNNAAGGKLLLDRPALNDQHVWVFTNGTLLTPSIDYRLTEDKTSIQLAITPDSTDKVEVMSFSSNVLSSGIAYMQFKDMLNRVHFKRLNLYKQARLVNDLQYTDLTIEVDDASNFDAPNPLKNRPGIVEICGERIEYFSLDGNTLGQLRRGTLGTGVRTYYKAGTTVQEIGYSETIPYNDSTVVEKIVSTGSTTVPISFIPSSVDEIEVFVAGVRLKKTPYTIYGKLDNGDIVLPDYPDSPEGDITLPAEFTVDGNSAQIELQLLKPIEVGTHIVVVKRTGVDWDGKQTLSILNDTNKISNFVKAVPGTWYIEPKKYTEAFTFDSTTATFDSTNTTFDQG